MNLFFCVLTAAEARARAIHHTQTENPLTLFVTDGMTKPLTGHLLYFIKPNAGKELKIRNVHEVKIIKIKNYVININL